jgi:twitching motility protein PilT
VAALEILVRTSGLANIIREGNTGQLPNLIQGGRKLGMCTMDESLENLLRAKRILPKDAYQRASDKATFEAYL